MIAADPKVKEKMVVELEVMRYEVSRSEMEKARTDGKEGEVG